jgi:DNA-directed RNA polymerase subunit RPC12/RpoP
MGKFKQSMARFFYGRYGTDTLNKTLLWIYVALVIVYTVVSMFFTNAIFTLLYITFSISLVLWIFSRMFSRKIAARRRENEKFCGFFRLRRNKLRDRKTHVYKKCPSCRAVLRLPKAKGHHAVVCPRCKHRFFVGRGK